VTRNNLAKRLGGVAAGAVALFALASVFSGSAAAVNSVPAADCVIACVATFDTAGSAGTIAIPAGITSLTATISGAAGAPAPVAITGDSTAIGGPGGVTTVDLGTTYAGQTLTAGVGATSQGSYIAVGSTLLAIAGGGGNGGYAGHLVDPDQTNGTYAGGAGGSPSAPGVAAGGISDAFGSFATDGGGGTAIGGAAGTGTEANGTAGGTTITFTNPAFVLAAGGLGGTTVISGVTHTGGTGGTGFTGGGGGGITSFDEGDSFFIDVIAPGGGGSGFLAPLLTATAGTPNTGAGSVVLTWSFSPTITTTATTVHRGDTVPVTITGLPANEAFTVVFDGTTVVTDTADSSGDATESFTVGSGQSAGHFPLGLVAGGGTVATSDPVAVLVTLATTGGPSPELPGILALLLILAGSATVILVRRRSAVIQ
jgi:hypothetical protein